MPVTKMRGVRVPDDVWDAARKEAARRNEHLSTAIVRLLNTYGRNARPGRKAPARKR